MPMALILGDSTENLEKSVHNLYLYCEKWHPTVNGNNKKLTLVLLNCFNCIFSNFKLELLTQFQASNDEKYYYL